MDQVVLDLDKWAFDRWAEREGLSSSERGVAEAAWLARSADCDKYRNKRIDELEAQLAAATEAARPTRLNSMRIGDDGDRCFADIRAAFVAPDGSIMRTVNGSTLPPGTDLYVLGDLIK